jgi:hypothetical protein
MVGIGLVVTLATTGVICVDWQTQESAQADDVPQPAATERHAIANRARIEGHEKCIDCHIQEVQAWFASKHATSAFDLLRTSPTSRQYAEGLGVRPSDIARKSLCITCHATPRHNQAGEATVISGVSCEACHNAAGGENGWLNMHAVYGPRGTRRGDESAEHLARRQASCRKAGQIRSANTYELVKRCFSCHVVSNEALAEVGHDHGDRFELVEKMLGEVRHNFFLDRTKNAEVATLWTDSLHREAGRTAAGRKRVLFIVGQLVDIETSLRSLATATEENDLSDLMIERVEDAFDLLGEDLLEELQETELPDIENVVKLIEVLLEKIDDDGFDTNDRKLYLEAAEKVAKFAQAFATRDGSKLTEVDELDLIPEGPFEDVYQVGDGGERDSLP